MTTATETKIEVFYSAANLFESEGNEAKAVNDRFVSKLQEALSAEFPAANISVDYTWDDGEINSRYDLFEAGVDYSEYNPADGNARVQSVCDRVYENGEFWA